MPSPEEQAAFIEEYGALVEKHKIDFAAYPMFVPDGEGSFKIMVQTQAVSTKEQPVKSPFIKQ